MKEKENKDNEIRKQLRTYINNNNHTIMRSLY